MNAAAERVPPAGRVPDPPCPVARHGGAGLGPALLARLLAFLFLALPLRAHDPFSSWTEAHIHDDRIELELSMSRSSALLLLADSAKLAPITLENFPGYEPKLKAIAGELFELSAGNRVLQPVAAGVQPTGTDDVAFRLRYPRPESGPLRFLGFYFDSLVDGHVGTLVVSLADGTNLGWSPLSVDQPAFEVTLPPAAATEKPVAATPPFATFLRLGIHHILIGYDHLLFLFGLIIACRRFKTMAGIITCFTLAHSITLTLAAFDVVTLSPRVVEPLIAASIVFVGVENLLLRGQEPRGRWLLTFGFGLVHGFGFAGALKAVGAGLAGRALAMPLFSFNLGVELGQIFVAAIFLPLLLALRKRTPFDLYGPPVVSSLVALAGGWWLLQRTVLS